jgi:SIR2-like domain
MEQAFEDLRNPYFDGFVGSCKPFFDLRAVEEKGLIAKHNTRFWKIHGSINWFKDATGNVYRGNQLDNNDASLIYPSHLKYDQSRKMPFLAMFDRLNNFLRQKDAPILITLGYSFFDKHINYAISNALKSNPSATVIGLMFGTSDTVEKEPPVAELGYKEAMSISLDDKVSNLSIWSYDEAIIGTIQGKWQHTGKSIEELEYNENPGKIIENITKSKKDAKATQNKKIEECHLLKLSDFKNFGMYLKNLIGDKINDLDAK